MQGNGKESMKWRILRNAWDTDWFSPKLKHVQKPVRKGHTAGMIKMTKLRVFCFVFIMGNLTQKKQYYRPHEVIAYLWQSSIRKLVLSHLYVLPFHTVPHHWIPLKQILTILSFQLQIFQHLPIKDKKSLWQQSTFTTFRLNLNLQFY